VAPAAGGCGSAARVNGLSAGDPALFRDAAEGHDGCMDSGLHLVDGQLDIPATVASPGRVRLDEPPAALDLAAQGAPAAVAWPQETANPRRTRV
jgi:hypothetical protein